MDPDYLINTFGKLCHANLSKPKLPQPHCWDWEGQKSQFPTLNNVGNPALDPG